MKNPEIRPNPLASQLDPPADSSSLRPLPEPLAEREAIGTAVLHELVGQSITSVKQFSRRQVQALCRLAAWLESVEVAPFKPLDGKIVITAFFEASTRTRTSFESAVLRLDGKLISISDGKTTGEAKGESLSDIGEMFNAYGDLVVMRHTNTSAIEELGTNLRIPLINAGNGSGEHPTQALADWYALLKWKPELSQTQLPEKQRLHLGILGTPGSMRAVKSFLLMSLLFRENIRKVTVVSEMADPFGDEVERAIKAAGIAYETTNDMQSTLSTFDVIYMNSLAFLGDSYRLMDSRYRLDESSDLKSDAVIMHPLARRDELSAALDKTSHNLYFSQAHGSIFIRQALMIAICDRFDRLPGAAPVE